MDIAYIIGITKALLDGLGIILKLFVIVLACSIPLGLCLSFLAKSKIKPLAWLTKAFIYIIRGTPLLLQLFFVFFGVKIIYLNIFGSNLNMDREFAAILTFTINYSAYFAEIFRGGLLSIDKGQYEAAQVLCMGKVKTFIKVIMPQMFRVTLPSITNESITLIKDTALISTISIMDMLHYAKVAVNRDSDITAFIVAAAIYLILNTILTFIFRKIEQKIDY